MAEKFSGDDFQNRPEIDQAAQESKQPVDQRLALENLPDVAIEKILEHLDSKGRKNIREVSRRLAQIVLLLRPELRAWRVKLDYFMDSGQTTFLNNLMDKGVPSLRHFKLYFDQAFTREHIELVNQWKDHVFGVEIGHEAAFPYVLKNLEVLTVWGAAIGAGGLSVVNVHSSTLKRLTIGITNFMGTGAGHASSVQVLPKLEALYIYCQTSTFLCISSMLNLGRNITTLSLNVFVDLTGMNPAHLKLPNLKQLRIEGPNKFKIVIANAGQLEMLSLQVASYLELEDFEMADAYPSYLPKIQMLCLEYSNDENMKVVTKLLAAAAKSLKHLVLQCTYDKDRYKNPYAPPQSRNLNMEQLTSLTHDHVSELTDSLTSKSSATLELLAIDLDATRGRTPKIPVNLPKLKQVVFPYTEDQVLTKEGGYIKQVQECHPQADVRGEKVEGYMPYANAYMKKLGVDEMLWLTGEQN